jgi:hypothetical protein
MKPIVFGLAMVVGGIAAPLAAQQAQPSPSEPAHKVFVLTGCLAVNPPPTNVFKLTGAVPVGQQVLPERGSANPGVKDEYELLPTSGLTEQGIGREELQTHVGKKVEVTVRPIEVSPGPSPSASSATPTAKAEEPAPQRYTVSKITSLAGSCP